MTRRINDGSHTNPSPNSPPSVTGDSRTLAEAIIPTSALYTYSTSVNAVSSGAWSYLVTTFSQSDGVLHIYLNGVEVTYGVQSAGSGSPEADSGAVGSARMAAMRTLTI